MRAYTLIILIAGLLLTNTFVNAQDCSPTIKGNNLVPSGICAPVTAEWAVNYGGITGSTVEFVYDWGDGNTVTRAAVMTAPGNYADTATYVYPQGGNQCNYQPRVYLRVDGQLCNSTVQEQNVTVWDTDNENGGNVSVDPQVFRVCVGNAATLNFTDNSTFNCVPPAENDAINNYSRWIQWIYGTGASDIANVEVGGAVRTYAYNGVVDVLNGPIVASGETSENIYVPPTATVGQQFEVTLKNWNVCNPYDSDTTDGNYLNPVSGNLVDGDYPAETTTGVIEIVDSPSPAFITREADASGALADTFCINEPIYLDNNTPGIAGASLQYTWEFYDNATATGSPVATVNGTNPTFSFATPGDKSIVLLARDANAFGGGCTESFTYNVNIISTAFASISLSDASGNPLGNPFCQNDSQSESFDVRFTNTSTNVSGSSEWTWNFYQKNSSSAIDSTRSGFGPFTGTYTEPGTYMVELITTNPGVTCFTSDTIYVNVYENPEVNFTFSQTCAGDSTRFTPDAQINTAVNGDVVTRLEWDFTNNGITDTTINNTNALKRMMGAAGSYPVTLVAETGVGQCVDSVTIDVAVDPVPFASFKPLDTTGCPGTAITFTMDTLLANQPTAIDRYTWYVYDSISGNTDQYVQQPAQDSFVPPAFGNNAPAGNRHAYHIWVEARASNGCAQPGDTAKVRIFPDPTAGFQVTNLSPTDKNCSPRTYELEVDPATQGFNPDAYRWEIRDEANNLVSDVTLAGSETDYDYTLVNLGLLVKQYTFRLTPDKDDVCFQPFEETLEVNPNPYADFFLSEVETNCDSVTLQASALQKGLIYDWSLSLPEADTSHSETDAMTIKIPRGAASKNLQVDLQTTNLANCQSNVETESSTVGPAINVDADFNVTPTRTTVANPVVSITNNTVDNGYTYTWNFGDGQTFNGQNPLSHTFPADTGRYTITLQAGSGSCLDADSAGVIIDPSAPQVDFDFTAQNGCAPLTVAFTNTSQYAEDHSYQWDFGDGAGTSTEESPQYTFTEPGRYTVELQGSNFNGTTASVSHVIEVYERPVANFNWNNEGATTAGAPVVFINNSEGAANYFWSFGDSTSSANSAPLHIYEEPGTYSIELVVNTRQGCEDTLSRDITIIPPPAQPDFTYRTVQGCDTVQVIFENTSENVVPGTYQWNFGDGSEGSTTENPSYTYREAGLYTVTLSGENPQGERASVTYELDIEPYGFPEAAFVFPENADFYPGDSISFTNLSVRANQYIWNFGDSTFSSDEFPKHAYRQEGTYRVELLARSFNGCEDSTSEEVTVLPEIPELDFTFDVENGCAPLQVNFTNTSRNADPDSYIWDFGDGSSISREANPSHVYTEPGLYTVTLQASNALGVAETVRKEAIIEVYPSPEAAFAFEAANQYFPEEEIGFINLSKGASAYQWNLGDSTTSTDDEPTHTYNISEVYPVSLVVTNDFGCTDSLVRRVDIQPLLPEVDFTFDPGEGCRPLTVNFTNQTKYAVPDGYRWSFGKGEGTSTEPNPSYTYYDPGVYSVVLEATNRNGVSQQVKKEFIIEVYDQPQAIFNLRPETVYLGEPLFTSNRSIEAISYNWDFGDGATSTEFEPEHTYESTGTYDIQLIARNTQGCVDTLLVPNGVTVENGGVVRVPNAFSPSPNGPGSGSNEAGDNDVFLPVYEGVSEFHMTIYNRWGELLFESHDPNVGWDGYYKGRLSPKDAYVYKLELTFNDGQTRTEVGDFVLLR